MRVIEYFQVEDRAAWLEKIRESDWSAGQYLYMLLKNDQLCQYAGDKARVLLLTQGENLISFCTLSEWDDIPETELMPWIGFVYTFPKFRGKRYMGRLLCHARSLAKADGFSRLYISTDQPGIYEKYGFHFLEIMKDRRGGASMVYACDL